MIFREAELFFRGSKDRLKRNVSKKGGEFPAPGRFRVLWRSPYFRRGLSFRMYGTYEKTVEGYRIVYRFLPTIGTVLWGGLPVSVLLGFALWELGNGNAESAIAVSLFSLLYPAIAVWQYFSCHRAMRQFFDVVTQ